MENGLIIVEDKKDLLKNNWLQSLDVAPATKKNYRQAITQLFDWMEIKGYEKLTPEIILEYKNWLKEKHQSVSTVNTYIAGLKKFCRYCHEMGYAPQNISTGLKFEKDRKGHKRPGLSEQQIRKVLKEIDTSSQKGARDYAIIALMSVTGLRVGSVATLKYGWLEKSEGRTILKYINKGESFPDSFAIIPPKLEQVINRYLEMRGEIDPEDPLFAPLDRNHSLTHINGCLTPKTISGAIKKRLEKVGLTSPYTAHSIRHSAAQVALMKGATIRQVQQMLGHKDPRVTEIYTEHIDRMLNPAEDILDDVLLSDEDLD